MLKTDKIYLVWQKEDDFEYFLQYNSLEDAVTENTCSESDEANDIEVFEATPKLLGTFKLLPTKVRVKKVNAKKA